MSTSKSKIGQTADSEEHLLVRDGSTNYFAQVFNFSNIVSARSENLLGEAGGVKGILETLKTNENGLNSSNEEDIKWRTEKYGDNNLIEAEDTPFYEFVLESLEDPMLRILIGASIVSLIIGILQEGIETGWIEGSAIFLAVFIVVAISSFNNWSKEKQFNKLNKENKKKNVYVRRDNLPTKEIDFQNLLVGDILHLRIGDIVTEDGILVNGSVSMDESNVNGESDLAKKNSKSPFILAGTQVKDGVGEMLVCAVGNNTSTARNRDLAKADEDDETPLQKKLKDLAGQIGDLGFIMAMFIGILMIIKEIILRYIRGDIIFTYSLLDTVVNAFIVAVTVIVVAIPEGLPMAVTISLAYSVMKMKEERNLVRHLDASETMGNVNTVCTDKTGTLTEGIMSIRAIYTGDKKYKDDFLRLPDDAKRILDEIVVNNMSAYIEDIEGKKTACGNPTECALLQYLLDHNLDIELVKHNKPSIHVLPFKSDYKFMISVYELEKESVMRLYVKGAPERVIDNCSEYLAENGTYKPINETVKTQFYKIQEEFAEQSMRTLALGYRDYTKEEFNKILAQHPGAELEFFSELKNEIKLVCIVGIADKPRPDVKAAIYQCGRSGVLVRMVTGDNIKTAIAISKDVGILNESETRSAMNRIRNKEAKNNNIDTVFGNVTDNKIYALEGSEFKELTKGYRKTEENVAGKKITKFELVDEKKFTEVVQNLKVIGRASPDDKFLLVFGLKKIGNIVAVTGDGTNDAPALINSHVGFAMGKRGTDIAKESSDIVLLDDSFSSIITAIKYGRNVYDCVRKFLQFQLTCNVVAVFMTLLGGTILSDSPLNAIQMLWVNLIMDSFASLALATEPPTDKLLERKPYPMDSNIITPMMMINIVSQAIFQIILLTIILFYGDSLFGVPSDRELSHFVWNDYNGYHFTIFFNIFVFLQVFNSINARKLSKKELNIFENIFDNYLYIFVQLFIVAGQIVMVQFGGRALRTQPLTVSQHLACMLIAALSLVIGFIIKLLPFDTEDSKSRTSIGLATRTRSTKKNTLPTSKSTKKE